MVRICGASAPAGRTESRADALPHTGGHCSDFVASAANVFLRAQARLSRTCACRSNHESALRQAPDSVRIEFPNRVYLPPSYVRNWTRMSQARPKGRRGVLSDTVLSPLLARDTGLFRRALVWPQANPMKSNHNFFLLLAGQIGTSFEAPSLRAGSRRPTFISWMAPRSMERRKKSKMSNPHQIAFYGKGASAKPPPTKQARRPCRPLRRKS